MKIKFEKLVIPLVGFYCLNISFLKKNSLYKNIDTNKKLLVSFKFINGIHHSVSGGVQTKFPKHNSSQFLFYNIRSLGFDRSNIITCGKLFLLLVIPIGST